MVRLIVAAAALEGRALVVAFYGTAPRRAYASDFFRHIVFRNPSWDFTRLTNGVVDRTRPLCPLSAGGDLLGIRVDRRRRQLHFPVVPGVKLIY